MGKVIAFDLISAVLGVPVYFIAAAGAALQPAAETQAMIAMGIGGGGAAVALIGGVFSWAIGGGDELQWWSALVASIGATVCFPPLGIASVIILLINRKQFTKLQKESKADTVSSSPIDHNPDIQDKYNGLVH